MHRAVFDNLKRGDKMVKVIKVISAIAVCVLAVAVFAPQAKADAAPSGALIYNCGPCGGSVLANGSGGFVGNHRSPLAVSKHKDGRGGEGGAFNPSLVYPT